VLRISQLCLADGPFLFSSNALTVSKFLHTSFSVLPFSSSTVKGARRPPGQAMATATALLADSNGRLSAVRPQKLTLARTYARTVKIFR
jgi:hypothetical protein